jgi:large subunit ribosomal protein L35
VGTHSSKNHLLFVKMSVMSSFSRMFSRCNLATARAATATRMTIGGSRNIGLMTLPRSNAPTKSFKSVSILGGFMQRMTPSVAPVAVSSPLLGRLGGVRFTTAGHKKALKTKKAVSKRFIVTGKGKLKRGHAFRGHLTSHKSPARKRRLSAKVVMKGTWAKKMKKLILTGK